MSDYQIVMDSAVVDVTIGDGAELQVEQALQYVKSGQKEIDSYVADVSKPEIAGYVETVSKLDLDAHTVAAKKDISGYVATVSKPDLDAYVEDTSKPEIAAYVESSIKPDVRAFATERTVEFDANAAAKQALVDAKALEAANSAAAALQSEKNAAASMTAAAASAQSAAGAMSAAQTSETNAKASENRCEDIFERLGTVIKIKGRVDTFEELPTTGNLDGDAYLVGVAGLTSYSEYYWFSDHWEFLGTSTDKIEWGTLQGNIAKQADLQQALDGKQAVITGAASTITNSYLTGNRAMVSNNSGKVAVSAVTSTELSYLSGVTSAVQTQLDGKQASSVGWGVPDYSAGVSISSLPYTAPNKGVVIICGLVANEYFVVSVNNGIVWSLDSNANIVVSARINVDKGDIVRAHIKNTAVVPHEDVSRGQQSIFYPCKGVI